MNTRGAFMVFLRYLHQQECSVFSLFAYRLFRVSTNTNRKYFQEKQEYL